METKEIVVRIIILIILTGMAAGVIDRMVRGFRGVEDEDDELEEPDTKPAPKIREVVEPSQQPQVRAPEKEPPAPEKQCPLSGDEIDALLRDLSSEDQEKDTDEGDDGKPQKDVDETKTSDDAEKAEKADDMTSLEANVVKFASAQIAEILKGGDAK